MENSFYVKLYQVATEFYGMIHSWFILTPKGLALMWEKYLNGVYGVCPRVLCAGQHVMPVGISDNPK